MKTPVTSKTSFLTRLPWRVLAASLAAVLICCPGGNARAASQTWTNAPIDNAWTNIFNWVGKAIPGAVNSTTVGDTVTFTNRLVNGIGGAGDPITNDYERGIKFMVFDTATCGPYVFGHSFSDYWLEIVEGGNIYVGAAETNPIVFNEALRVRFPSSSNGTLLITNNSPVSTAALYFSAFTNTSSSTRPLNFFLAGVNSGSNIIARIDDQAAAAGAILIDVVGASTNRWILSGPNDLPQKTSASVVAHINVTSGILEVQDPAACGSIAIGNFNVQTNGTLQIDNVTLNNAGITLKTGGTILMNGAGTVNAVAVSALAGTYGTLATMNPSDVMTVGITGNSLSGGANDTVLHVTGPGTVFLSQSSSYVGAWSLDKGITQIASAQSFGNALAAGKIKNIAAGATLDVSPLGAGYYEIPAFGASGTGTTVGTSAATIKADPAGIVDLASSLPMALTYSPATFTGDASHPALYISQGTLSLNGNTFNINNASGTPLGVGTYLLVQQATGNISSTSSSYVANVSGSGKAAGSVASIQIVNGSVNLVISAYVAKNLVWTGGDNYNPSQWDVGTTTNWLNGASHSVFSASDYVLFNAVGISNATVSLSGTLAPGGVTVDTTGGNYTLTGSGQIAGSTSLAKVGAGTLVLSTANSYSGGTVISNGTVQLGVMNAVPGTGSGDVTILGGGLLDLNANSDTINGLNGSGTIDTLAGGAPVLTIGNNNDGGTFSGVLQNSTIGTTGAALGLTKAGNGTELLTGTNLYSGPTVINAGTLKMGSPLALSTNANVTVNSGQLDLNGNSPVLGVLAGAGNIINSGSGGSTLSIISSAANTFNGVITDNGVAAGQISLFVSGGSSLRLNGVNTYSGGTIVDIGTTLATGGTGAQLGTGGILASNGATIAMPNTGSQTPTIANNVTTAPNATVSFTSGSTANQLSGLFIGGPTATNILAGNMSVGATYAFSNFLGTVIFPTVVNGTRFNQANAVVLGGDNTTFSFQGGGVYMRNSGILDLGSVNGGTGTSGITGPTYPPSSSIWFGAKGVDNTFEGVISGSNNVVKMGTARLALDGENITTNTDDATYTNLIYSSSIITYVGNTTISNGVLALTAPNNLNNSPLITLAASTAVLDASAMGYVTNFNDLNGNPDSALVTNGVFEVLALTPAGNPEELTGIGTIRGSLLVDSGSTLAVGLPLGTLTVTNTADIEGTLTFSLNRTNATALGKNSELAVTRSTVVNGAILVTNLGPDLGTGDVYHLFSHAISGAWTLSLPVQNVAGTITYSYQTNLATDGSIKVLVGAVTVNTNPTNIIATLSGNVLNLAWPADHTGWRLLVQTNNLALGVSSNTNDWTTVAGSTAIDSTNIIINPALPNEFYRLVYP